MDDFQEWYDTTEDEDWDKVSSEEIAQMAWDKSRTYMFTEGELDKLIELINSSNKTGFDRIISKLMDLKENYWQKNNFDIF